MARRFIHIISLLILLAGCSEDTHKPLTRELVLEDLRLSVQLSSNRIVRGDTLLIEMAAYNPYSKPLDVTFGGYGCEEWFWVYDEQGELVSPHQICLDSRCREPQEDFHMDPLEERRFTHEWVACGVNPGHCTVVAGFNAPPDGSPHTAGPVKLEILPRDEDVTGVWSGAFLGIWRGSVWESQHFALALTQERHTVSGTLSVGSTALQIENGVMQDYNISFSVSLASAGSVAEFTGDVCHGRISGRCYVLDALSREILEDMYWNVWLDE